ncbi:hypothetical protein ACPA54_37890 [Uniformispora flossi]|uniref:hypothetical protein n=1 Tax=Uniformispora flossi TaxID=3390723 RepID=UPI003C2EFF58
MSISSLALLPPWAFVPVVCIWAAVVIAKKLIDAKKAVVLGRVALERARADDIPDVTHELMAGSQAPSVPRDRRRRGR